MIKEKMKSEADAPNDGRVPLLRARSGGTPHVTFEKRTRRSASLPTQRPQKFSPRRLWALMRKEAIQIMTDPSSILIAFILPVMLLFLFGYAVSLDTTRIRIGVVLEERTPESENLLTSLRNSRYLDVTVSFDRAV